MIHSINQAFLFQKKAIGISVSNCQFISVKLKKNLKSEVMFRFRFPNIIYLF